MDGKPSILTSSTQLVERPSEATLTTAQLLAHNGTLQRERSHLLSQLAAHKLSLHGGPTCRSFETDDVLRLRDVWWRLQSTTDSVDTQAVIMKELEEQLSVLLEAERGKAQSMKAALVALRDECTVIQIGIEAALRCGVGPTSF